MKNLKFTFSKKFYGVKGALHSLDEEFSYFNVKPKSPNEFFILWNEAFYSLQRKTHQHLLTKSTNYAYPNGRIDERTLEKQELEEQLKDIQREIDSKEKEHIYFTNNIFLIRGDASIQGDNLTTIGEDIGPWYVQSGKKRFIESLDLYHKLKTKTNKFQSDKSDKEFLVFMTKNSLNGLPTGPSITNVNDIYIDPLEINIYPQTLDEYNNGLLNVALGNINEGNANELTEKDSE